MEIYLFRHGKTKGNLEHRYVGRTDEPLDLSGIPLLKNKQTELAGVEKVYSSPMLRCIQTAGICWPETEIQTVDQLRETDFGIFEYKNYEELKNQPEYQQWISSGGTAPIPHGESGEAFRERSIRAFIRCLKEASEEGLHKIAFCVHGGTIMAVMDGLAGDEKSFYDWQAANGCGYDVYWDETKKDQKEIRLKLRNKI